MLIILRELLSWVSGSASAAFPQEATENVFIIEWMKRAEQGHIIAQVKLGLIYDKGRGVPQDYQEAIRWYHAAAEQGDTDTPFILEVIYDKGEGVSEDYVQAYMWWNLAASRQTGDKREKSVKFKDFLVKKITREQIAEGQRLARE